ncbi:MAG: glycosyltransferase family 8 protein [Candidatus Gastranaerophilales bacterium]|nr:glycosyltransferase family 8 protein [Candidatus Gastranaerophilales bacterium]
MNIALSTDDNYAKYAGVVIASILENNKNEDLVFYILDGGITPENKEKIMNLITISDCEIQFIKIDDKLFEDYKKIKTHKYINIATFYRLKLGSLLPNIDKVLYLDCDVVVNSNIKELYDTDIDNYYAAGAKDIACQTHNKKPELKEGSLYVNAGMLLFNLDKIRNENIEEKYLEYTQKNFENIFLGDQQIINVVLQGYIKQVDDCWNLQSSNFINRSIYMKNPKLIHYIGKQKPWIFASLNYYKDLYFKYLQMTDWQYTGKDIWKHQTLSQICSIFKYVMKKPFFLFRPRFYKAFYHTYIKQI